MYRILIVDDEKNERDCILYLLKNCGFELEIKEAEDGVEALTADSKDLASPYFIYRCSNAAHGWT